MLFEELKTWTNAIDNALSVIGQKFDGLKVPYSSIGLFRYRYCSDQTASGKTALCIGNMCMGITSYHKIAYCMLMLYLWRSPIIFVNIWQIVCSFVAVYSLFASFYGNSMSRLFCPNLLQDNEKVYSPTYRIDFHRTCNCIRRKKILLLGIQLTLVQRYWGSTFENGVFIKKKFYFLWGQYTCGAPEVLSQQ
jgi:hypothetical protein